MADGIEQRRSPRYGAGGPVKVILHEGETISGRLENVSQSGMLVALPLELELGRTYGIEVTDSQGVLCLNGEALRLHLPPRSDAGRDGSGVRIGFEFVGIDVSARERLGRFLEEVVT